MSEPARSARILGMIGLAKRAGYLLCGTDAVISSAASGKKPPLVVCASDASERTKKQLSDKCATYGVTYRVLKTSLPGTRAKKIHSFPPPRCATGAWRRK